MVKCIGCRMRLPNLSLFMHSYNGRACCSRKAGQVVLEFYIVQPRNVSPIEKLLMKICTKDE